MNKHNEHAKIHQLNERKKVQSTYHGGLHHLGTHLS